MEVGEAGLPFRDSTPVMPWSEPTIFPRAPAWSHLVVSRNTSETPCEGYPTAIFKPLGHWEECWDPMLAVCGIAGKVTPLPFPPRIKTESLSLGH